MKHNLSESMCSAFLLLVWKNLNSSSALNPLKGRQTIVMGQIYIFNTQYLSDDIFEHGSLANSGSRFLADTVEKIARKLRSCDRD